MWCKSYMKEMNNHEYFERFNVNVRCEFNLSSIQIHFKLK